MELELAFTEFQGCCNSTVGKFDSITFQASFNFINYLDLLSSQSQVEVNLKTTKKTAQSDHEIVPRDGPR